MRCNVLSVSHLLGKKWIIILIEEIALDKFSGFNTTRKRLGKITPTTLSNKLRELEHYGLVEKLDSGGRSTYRLTKRGWKLHEIVLSLKKWNVKWNNMPKACLKIVCTDCERLA